MDFKLTEDQQLLRETVSKFLSRHYAFERRKAIAAAGGFDEGMWRQFAELGLLGAPFEEASGGLGGSVEAMVIMEEFGRRLVVEPMIACCIAAGTLLVRGIADRGWDERLADLMAGNLRPCLATLEAGMRSPYDIERTATRAARDGGRWVLSGKKSIVFDGGAATHYLVTARNATHAGLLVLWVAAEQDGLERRRFRTIDGRTACSLAFDGLSLGEDALVCDAAAGRSAVLAALNRSSAAVCAEAVGSMSYLLEATVAYTRQREQYGAPLASYQALQHRMADMLVALETARSMSFLATSAVSRRADNATADVAAAMVQVGRSARFVGQQAVQLHGGMGMSEEVDVANHFKRLTAIARAWGDEASHLRRFAAAKREAGVRSVIEGACEPSPTEPERHS